jgi:integrase
VHGVERFIAAERRDGRAPKSIRNYLGTLHSIFELAIEQGWARANPVKRAGKPEGGGDYSEVHFLTVEELEAVLVAAPDDALGSLERVLYLTAAMTGLRQGELLGLRWEHVDWLAGKVRVRGHTKSRRSIRAVPLAARVAAELEGLSRRSAFTADEDLVFGHPHTGRTVGSFQGPQALQGGGEGGWGPRRSLPRSTAHVRDADGGSRNADADLPGVDGAPRR